ncbi:MAG: hypothetical protein ABL986_22910 [Vicinamibacterales bacterium]
MTSKQTESSSVVKVLVQAARGLPGVSVGVACAGTTMEARTFSAGSKAFLFIGRKDARLKLSVSLRDADVLAARPDTGVKVGAHGWTTIAVQRESSIPQATLTQWVVESHSLVSGAGGAARPAAQKSRRRAKTR